VRRARGARQNASPGRAADALLAASSGDARPRSYRLESVHRPVLRRPGKPQPDMQPAERPSLSPSAGVRPPRSGSDSPDAVPRLIFVNAANESTDILTTDVERGAAALGDSFLPGAARLLAGMPLLGSRLNYLRTHARDIWGQNPTTSLWRLVVRQVRLPVFGVVRHPRRA
jgi:hypothetical protein